MRQQADFSFHDRMQACPIALLQGPYKLARSSPRGPVLTGVCPVLTPLSL